VVLFSTGARGVSVPKFQNGPSVLSASRSVGIGLSFGGGEADRVFTSVKVKVKFALEQATKAKREVNV
jgi:hypothetical protein